MTADTGQARAWARDLADTGMPVLAVDLAHGEQCGWCACPADAAADVDCGGCSAPACAVLRIYPAPPPALGDAWPVCTGHRDDALRVLQTYMASRADPG